MSGTETMTENEGEGVKGIGIETGRGKGIAIGCGMKRTMAGRGTEKGRERGESGIGEIGIGGGVGAIQGAGAEAGNERIGIVKVGTIVGGMPVAVPVQGGGWMTWRMAMPGRSRERRNRRKRKMMGLTIQIQRLLKRTNSVHLWG